ncbi:TIGR04282 family arsenosugar biosynthesis glycosyltransferase [Leptospira sp. 1 VSF14]|uniref:TIGR04282 family arsenosugar biosynthesis glycosyltransferase n=1 Tax=Leptospira paudalimensis TaxID=2950024 RepID=A0ABT3M4B8_9LEPT|nr:TIGR04282 family arsenosugar biosynthesis glycosyltransferase [Leptospira paudalimensis]
MESKKLIIFAKQPIQGQVKTRLAKTLGDKTTLDIYKKLLHITEDITTKLNISKTVYWDQIPNQTNSYFKNGYSFKVQSQGDLGKKMQDAFREEFGESFKKILIIGTDCPYLTEAIFQDAFLALENSDIVIGPAKDGGYYLLGMNELYPSLFEEIPWSTELVFALTIKKSKELNLSVSILPELNDIDTEKDWLEWEEKINQ